MPRTYNRLEGARKYGYSAESMQQAVVNVKEHGISIREAAFLQCKPNNVTESFEGIPQWIRRSTNIAYQ